MSLHIAKLFTRPRALASAALIIHMGAAVAADSTGDIQRQLKEMLAGNPTAHSVPRSAPTAAMTASPGADAHESARQFQFLLGTAIKHAEVIGSSRKTKSQERKVAYGDAQAAAREVLVGPSHASNAS